MNKMERFVAWYIGCLIVLAFFVGCTPALVKCRNWNAIEKEREAVKFQCLSEGPEGWRCNRARWHYRRHHSHSLENDCISWR